MERDGNRLSRSRFKQALDSTELINLEKEIKGVSLIQAARNGWTEVVENILQTRKPEQIINDVDEEGYSAIHYAAKYNHTKIIEQLVKHGADVDLRQGQDMVTPLHLAARYNSEAAACFLIDSKASVSVKDAKGRTQLHYATWKGYEMMFKILISVASSSVNVRDRDGMTPLIMCALQGSERICKALISEGADVKFRDINDMTPLMWAAAEGHTKVCEVLLRAAQHGGTDNLERYIQMENKEGYTALHLAVTNGSLEVVNLLLDHSADVDPYMKNATSPLHLAATNGFIDIVKVLVSKGASVNSRDVEQMTPMHRAALYNKVDVLEFLVTREANINAKDKMNMSPLLCACWKGQVEAVKYLLNNGAQIDGVDIAFKSVLHWAVQYGHIEVVKLLLKQDSGQSLVTYTDKNDQTVLHYAAYKGDVQILLILLEAGARPNAKDQEERCPLHVASQNDKVVCIEALIKASNHETNADDIDGRTPLLLACLSGHYHSAEVLLSVGGDICRRDDEHCTALMLAASQGYKCVMKILLENHAAVNDVDKMRNTALHYACAGGHVNAVQLLLDKQADVTLTNSTNKSALDLAIDNLHQDVVVAMLKNKSICQACMKVRDSRGYTPIDKLITKLPDTVLIILDHCVERTMDNDEEKNLTVTMDYQYIDPGPDDPSCKRNRYLALNTMVAHDRDTLISHPLCQNLLLRKWIGFGRKMFIFNLLIYIGYLSCLTPSVVFTENIALNFCEGYLSHTDSQIERYVRNFIIMTLVIYILVGIFIIRELVRIYSQKWRYFLRIHNLIVWMLIGTSVLFVIDIDLCGEMKGRTGWMVMFLVWINFIMYLRRIDFIGIYVIMFVSVLSSLMKLLLVFLMFVAAFVSSLYLIMKNEMVRVYPGNDQCIDLKEANTTNATQIVSCFTQNVGTIFMRVLVMTLGEIDKDEGLYEHYELDGNIIFVIFIFLMPIALMNFMIGVAVGDIEKIQRNAYIRRIGLKVDLIYDIENNMPKCIQRKIHVRKATMETNSESWCSWLCCWRKQRMVQFIQEEKTDPTNLKLELLVDKMQVLNQRVKSIMMLQQEANQRSNVYFGDLQDKQRLLAMPPSVQPSQSITVPSNLPVPESVSIYADVGREVINRWRRRTIRPQRNDFDGIHKQRNFS